MRTVIRGLFVVVVLLVIVFFAFGWWSGSRVQRAVNGPAEPATATSGTVDSARQRGAEIGEKVGEASAKVGETIGEAAVTAKIKAKMALDDSVKSRSIDVTTNGSKVTLSGSVQSAAERDRAMRIARETDGVTQVIDHLDVKP
jgi:hyperosmotically inducible protein